MTNSVTVKEAYKLIDEIPVEKLKYVIQFLRGAKGLLGDKKENNKQKEIAFNNFLRIIRKGFSIYQIIYYNICIN